MKNLTEDPTEDPTLPEPHYFSDDSSDSTIAPEEAIARDNGDNGPVGFPFVFGAGINPGLDPQADLD